MTETAATERLGRRGRAARWIATALGTAVLLAGSVRGSDDDFPFGPFRMYAGVDRLDAPVADTRVEALDVASARVLLTEDNTGIRRAEIEGQLPRFTAHPALLAAVARAYAEHNPSAPGLAEIQIVVRWYEVRGGYPTGETHDQTLVTWQRENR